jgi:dipeptidyl aminopeptidase/acylaminoacyl peptidase
MGDRPICLYGESAGAHLALLAAEQRPDEACVVDQAGPTDLNQLGSGPVAVASKVFGYRQSELAEASPITHLDRLHAPVLIAQATNDPFVSIGQSRALHEAYQDSTLVELPDGAAEFVHHPVDPGALADYVRYEQAFIEQALEG